MEAQMSIIPGGVTDVSLKHPRSLIDLCSSEVCVYLFAQAAEITQPLTQHQLDLSSGYLVVVYGLRCII